MIRFSTATLNFMLSRGSLKKCFEDGALCLYSGTQPSNPDMAVPNGSTLLCTISKASGTFTAGAPSTRQEDYVKVTTVGGQGDTHVITINGTAYTYTVPSGSPTVSDVAKGLASLVDADSNVAAFEVIAAAESGVKVRSRWGGVSYTIAKSNTGTAALATVQNDVVSVRANGLQWGGVTDSTNGNILVATLGKEGANAFSGVASNSGVLGWGRLKGNTTDNDTQDSAYAHPRMDFSIGSSSADLVVGSTSVQSGATITLDTFNLVLYSGAS